MADYVYRYGRDQIREDWIKKQAEGAEFAKDQYTLHTPVVSGNCPYCGSYNTRWLNEIVNVEIEHEIHGLDFCINCNKPFLWERTSRLTDEEMSMWGGRSGTISLNCTDA